MFARQVIAYGRAGDVVLAISTSGNSVSVLDALGQGSGARDWRGGAWSATTAAAWRPRRSPLTMVIVTRSQHIPRIQEAQASALHVLRELIEIDERAR